MATRLFPGIYARDSGSFEGLKNLPNLPEIHIILEAYEYSATPGDFKPDWDEKSITPDLIDDYKKNSPSRFRFFVSIGRKYPFAVKDSDKDTWVNFAYSSLEGMINKYHLDGIDVYYQRIDTNAVLFAYAIERVLGRFLASPREEKVIISMEAATDYVNRTYYKPLLENCSGNIIMDTVLYQFQKQT